MHPIDVNGKNAHDLFVFCRRHSPLYDEKKDTISEIPWNFAKFLLNGEGKVCGYAGPREKPDKLRPEIEKLLA